VKLSDNDYVKQLILTRLEELDMKDSELLNDAAERGYFINRSRLSKYRNGKPGSLNDEDVHWIMERLGIQYNVNFGVPTINEGKLVYVVPKYDELKALKRLNLLFKRNGKK
jgi:hypothetical protein